MKLLNLKSPLGSKESPARSCLDLLLDDPEISNGIYIALSSYQKHFSTLESWQVSTGSIPMVDVGVMQ